MTVEERLRATTEAVTAAMRPVRPLDLRRDPAFAQAPAKRRLPPHPRRWPGWLIPLAAAAAVIAVAATLVAVRSLSAAGPGSRPAPASTSTLTSGIPRYFVTLNTVGTSPKGAVERNAFLDDEGTGKQLATFKPPSDALFVNVAAAPDDRTFVLEAAAGPGFGPAGNVKLVTQGATDIWYVLRVTPGAAAPQARLTRVPVVIPDADSAILGFAVSPGGRSLAVLSAGTDIPAHAASSRPLQLRTYSLATGRALRSWTAPLPQGGPFATENNLTWLDDGRTVAFDYPASIGHVTVRTLDTTRPGTSLIAGSRQVFSEPDGGACFSALLTSDGKSVICGTLTSTPLPAGVIGTSSHVPTCNKGGVELAAYSVATGKLDRVVYRYTAGGCSWGTAQVVWARSATLVIGAIVITKSAAPHPQVSTLVAAAQGKFAALHGTWAGPGWIAY